MTAQLSLVTLAVVLAANVGATEPAATSAASVATDPTHCEWDDFIYGGAQLSVAEVKAAAPRVHFLKYAATCPKGLQQACGERAYLVPGDKVAVAKHHAGLVCAWFNRRNVNDEIVGWLPATAVDETTAPSSPKLLSWVKEWSRYIAPGNESSLTISLDPDGHTLHVKGFGEWLGGGATEPHLGEFEGSALPQGNRLTITDNGCVVELFLLDDYTLFARDHFDCGGMNVTFRGLY